MRLLLDTHVFLWWTLGEPRLAPTALSMLVDPANGLFLSSASGFEIATKVGIGKLKLPTDVESFVADGMRRGRVDELPATLRHAYRVVTLPPHHRDPFDRLLIATALEEGLDLLTNDPEVRKYPVKTVW